MRAGSQQEGAACTIRQNRVTVRARLAELGLCQPLRGLQVGSAEVYAHGGGVVEPCAGKVRAFEVGAVQAGVLKAGIPQNSFPEGALLQVGTVEMHAGQIRSTEF